MCSRYALNCAPEDLVQRYGLSAPPRGGLPIPEIRPTDAAPVAKGGRGVLLRKRFGIPSRVDGKPLINARSETLTEKPTFRRLLDNRVLVPATAYFEWRKDGKARHRNTIAPGQGDPAPAGEVALFSIAALVEGEHFTLITCDACPAVAHVHARMPIILPREAEALWLSDAPFADVAHLLRPYEQPIAAVEETGAYSMGLL